MAFLDSSKNVTEEIKTKGRDVEQDAKDMMDRADDDFHKAEGYIKGRRDAHQNDD